ncbi:MAG: hypothetical protein M3365_08305, partial [Gemmatimonadota bacterium]|nr:hypothetical protein [Gemmatimonadota bacterium]
SSQETYGGTIQFYERTGYEPVGKITDYYKAGDDKLIFAKRLPVTKVRVEEAEDNGARVEATGAASSPFLL